MIIRWCIPVLWRGSSLLLMLLLLWRISLLSIILRISYRIRIILGRRRRCRIMLGVVLLGVLLRFLILRVRVSRSRGRFGLCRQLGGIVSRHFLVEPLLIVVRLIFILLLLLGGQCPPALAHDVAHFGEFHLWGRFHDFGTLIECEEDVRSACTLGRIGIFVFLGILARPSNGMGIHQLTGRVKSGRRGIICHFSFIPGLVL
mmetsp:Transcript_3832/g.5975  ORF Transcript_3832/g.5975 Transcript_3832/m.5975 type:complete len:202 (-) Transcript_3832:660-1265(-)